MQTKTFKVEFSLGECVGPYSIYYDLVDKNSVAKFEDSNLLTIGITLEDIKNGFNIKIPSTASRIIIYNLNPFCKKISQVIPLAQPPTPTPTYTPTPTPTHTLTPTYTPTVKYYDSTPKISYEQYNKIRNGDFLVKCFDNYIPVTLLSRSETYFQTATSYAFLVSSRNVFFGSSSVNLGICNNGIVSTSIITNLSCKYIVDLYNLFSIYSPISSFSFGSSGMVVKHDINNNQYKISETYVCNTFRRNLEYFDKFEMGKSLFYSISTTVNPNQNY